MSDKRDIQELLSNRPSKETVYLTMAFVIAQRSFDPSSKCGCLIVSKDDRILSAGYNGPIKGSDDTKIPLERPYKYYHMLHSEENALLAYNGSYQDIIGATAYVTGKPCHKCFRMMIQKGITKIVYGTNHTKVLDQDDYNAQKLMLEYGVKVDIKELDSNDDVILLLNGTNGYIEEKNKAHKNYEEKENV